MILQRVQQELLRLQQEHLLEELAELSSDQIESLLQQLKKYSQELAQQQKELAGQSAPEKHLAPYCSVEKNGNASLGRQLLLEGKVGCLIMAGGQGTRLGAEGPKGIVPVTAVRGKSLFQVFAEKTKAASDWAGKKLPLCIMTSSHNHQQTLNFFKEHHFFGLDAAQVFFFEQAELPLLDLEGKWMFQSPGVLLEGPDGNGHALHHFFNTGIWAKFKERGVEYLQVMFVDNPLADPFDLEFVGLVAEKKWDAALKVVERLSPEEKMGVLANQEGRLKVIEYSEIPAADSASYTLSSTGIFCLSMDFIPHLSRSQLPLHLARKTAKTSAGTIPVYKCERFIFDLLDSATSSGALLCSRENTYAPLKNATGDKSLETVKAALLQKDKKVYEALTGKAAPHCDFELDPAYYYPSDLAKQQLSLRKILDKEYIDLLT